MPRPEPGEIAAVRRRLSAAIARAEATNAWLDWERAEMHATALADVLRRAKLFSSNPIERGRRP